MINHDCYGRKKRGVRHRRLVLIDVENLAGCSPVSPKVGWRVVQSLTSIVRPDIRDVVLVGSHPGNAMTCRWVARIMRGTTCLRRGPDGADLALIEGARNIPLENFTCEFNSINKVIICSGDHIFVEIATVLKKRGVEVTVVSKRSSLNTDLSVIADHILLLDQSQSDESATVA